MGASGHASNDGTMVGSPSKPGETGLLLIMAGPSGVGKTTIVHELIGHAASPGGDKSKKALIFRKKNYPLP
jgi:ABC-type lipoprotein export system ATPase subunit